MTLRLFTDRRYLPEDTPHVPLLYPFWGIASVEPAPADRGIYNRFAQKGRNDYELTTLDDAQLAVLPFAWEYAEHRAEALSLAVQLATQAAQHHIPLLIFYHGDREAAISVPNSVIFRTSLTRSRLRSNEHILPAWTADFADVYCGGQILVRPKGQRPVVGFCGDVSSGSRLRDRVRRVLGSYPAIWRLGRRLGIELIQHPGSRLRLHTLKALARSPAIEPNLVLRYGHWNNAVYRGRILDPVRLERSRREYVANMIGSDYILCVRGKGNYSYRLYETLSCGRIPVFINTDCVLPYEQWIDWRQFCVWVEARDLLHTAECVADFHNSLSPAQFEELQRACRQLWLDWFSPEAFFANLHRHFI